MKRFVIGLVVIFVFIFVLLQFFWEKEVPGPRGMQLFHYPIEDVFAAATEVCVDLGLAVNANASNKVIVAQQSSTPYSRGDLLGLRVWSATEGTEVEVVSKRIEGAQPYPENWPAVIFEAMEKKLRR